jgi:hypothetical protein
MPTIEPLDPNHIPPLPGRPKPGPVAGGLRITVIGLGPVQEACLAGMLALALSWASAELLVRAEAGGEAAPRPILSAALQP